MNEPEIYFHVGLGKVASTYLQKKILPDIARSNNLIYWSNTYKLKSLFNKVDYFKPKSSRQESSEIFIVSREFKINE